MKLLGKIPKDVYLACSGGKDSMTILYFLLQGRRNVHVLYFNHKTKHGKEAQDFLYNFCMFKNIPISIGLYQGTEQTEVAWRDARYDYFSNFKDKPIITGHHLKDNIETWLMSSISGHSKFIPYSRNNIIRPFLLTNQKDMERYANNYKVEWIEDPSNKETKYSRNKIRNLVFPVLEDISPGIETVFYYKCLEKYEKDGVI